ncbi:MAG: hypothetical protein U0174_02480 [Polyangiaceae bacterium]
MNVRSRSSRGQWVASVSSKPALFALVCLAASVSPACGGGEASPPVPPVPTAAPTPPTPPVAATTAAPVATAPSVSEPPKANPPTNPAVVWKDMATPESVLYDADGDRYLVSNINGGPLDADNNGFISELSPDGTVKKLKFIEGGKKATLNAPKGSVIVKGVFYVADIDHVRMFDAKTGAPKGAIKVPEATFLNDMAASPDGRIFVSDSGLRQDGEGFAPTGSDAVYEIVKGKPVAIVKSKSLEGPNGLLFAEGRLLVNTFNAAHLFSIADHYLNPPKKQKVGPGVVEAVQMPPAMENVTKLPNGGLDGLVYTGTSYVVSSWGGKAVYRGALGGVFATVLDSIAAAADMGYDTKRKRLLVPRFMGNVVEAYDIQ